MLTFGLRHWFSISLNSRTIFQTSAYLDAEYVKLVTGSHLGQFGYHCSEKSPWSFSKIFNIRASNCPPSSHVPTQTEDKSRISAVSLEMGSGYGIVVHQPLEARAQVIEREGSGGGQKHASHCLSEFCLLSS